MLEKALKYLLVGALVERKRKHAQRSDRFQYLASVMTLGVAGSFLGAGLGLPRGTWAWCLVGALVGVLAGAACAFLVNKHHGDKYGE